MAAAELCLLCIGVDFRMLYMCMTHGQDDDGSNPGQVQALQQECPQEASAPLQQSQQDQGKLVV